MHRNYGKLPLYKIPTTFESTLEAQPSRQYGTLQHFFESCLSLSNDHKALVNIEKFLYHWNKMLKDFVVNSL